MAEDLPPPLIPSLPDEISMRCIARVSVVSHMALAQVSRSWRSLVRSTSFSSLRSELAVTELVLTVCIENEPDGRHRWYHLHPFQTPFPLPTQEHEHDFTSTCASLGSRLFLIGGDHDPDCLQIYDGGDHDPNSLQIYDGRLRRWSVGPRMSEPRADAAIGVAGGRIHVLGRYCAFPSVSELLAESLDPDGNRWEPVPPIPAHLVGNRWHSSDILDGKLLVASKRDGQLFCAAFDPDTAEWAHAPSYSWWANSPMNSHSYVVRGVPYVFERESYVVRGVPYVFENGRELLGYDHDNGQWRPVEGESMTELMSRMIKNEIRLLTFGDLVCLVGELEQPIDELDEFTVLIFAGIDISRTANGGFKGSIVWLDNSLKYFEGERLDQFAVLEL